MSDVCGFCVPTPMLGGLAFFSLGGACDENATRHWDRVCVCAERLHQTNSERCSCTCKDDTQEEYLAQKTKHNRVCVCV